jgi:hypothetical protein
MLSQVGVVYMMKIVVGKFCFLDDAVEPPVHRDGHERNGTLHDEHGGMVT